MWKKVIIGCIPAGVIGVLFNDLIDKYLMNWLVVAIMLIVVGIAFIAIEMRNHKVRPSIVKFTQLSYKTAFIIGVFQLLALIPGTSRSGITIIGGMLFGCSRFIAAEYTFYLAIPVMFGASGLKLVKFTRKGWWILTRAVLCRIIGINCILRCVHDRNQVLDAVYQAS